LVNSYNEQEDNSANNKLIVYSQFSVSFLQFLLHDKKDKEADKPLKHENIAEKFDANHSPLQNFINAIFLNLNYFIGIDLIKANQQYICDENNECDPFI